MIRVFLLLLQEISLNTFLPLQQEPMESLTALLTRSGSKSPASAAATAEEEEGDASGAAPAPRRGGARSATTTSTTRRATKKEALPSPLAMPGIDDDIGDGEENFLSLPEGGAGALDFNCSPIGAVRKGGDVAQPAASSDDLNMEVSPLKQQQQPKSAAKVRERERENGRAATDERALAPLHASASKRHFFLLVSSVRQSPSQSEVVLQYLHAC